MQVTMWTSSDGADVMTLTRGLHATAQDATLRLLAPVLVLLGLALLALVPGILIHIGDRPQNAPAQRIDGFMTYEGR